MKAISKSCIILRWTRGRDFLSNFLNVSYEVSVFRRGPGQEKKSYTIAGVLWQEQCRRSTRMHGRHEWSSHIDSSFYLGAPEAVAVGAIKKAARAATAAVRGLAATAGAVVRVAAGSATTIGWFLVTPTPR